LRIAFNTWMYAAFPAWLPLRSLDDVIDLAAELGFDGLEIGAAAPHAFPDYLDDARRKDIRARLEGHGLEVSAMCPTMGGGPGYNPASPEEAERRAGAAYVGEVLRLASTSVATGASASRTPRPGRTPSRVSRTRRRPHASTA
jgi:protein FrlC